VRAGRDDRVREEFLADFAAQCSLEGFESRKRRFYPVCRVWKVEIVVHGEFGGRRRRN
jgi:hypothetical protein